MTTSTLNFGWDFWNEPEVHRPKCFHRRNGSESGRRQIGWSTLMQGNVCCRAIGAEWHSKFNILGGTFMSGIIFENCDCCQ